MDSILDYKHQGLIQGPGVERVAIATPLKLHQFFYAMYSIGDVHHYKLATSFAPVYMVYYG